MKKVYYYKLKDIYIYIYIYIYTDCFKILDITITIII